MEKDVGILDLRILSRLFQYIGFAKMHRRNGAIEIKVMLFDALNLSLNEQ